MNLKTYNLLNDGYVLKGEKHQNPGSDNPVVTGTVTVGKEQVDSAWSIALLYSQPDGLRKLNFDKLTNPHPKMNNADAQFASPTTWRLDTLAKNMPRLGALQTNRSDDSIVVPTINTYTGNDPFYLNIAKKYLTYPEIFTPDVQQEIAGVAKVWTKMVNQQLPPYNTSKPDIDLTKLPPGATAEVLKEAGKLDGNANQVTPPEMQALVATLAGQTNSRSHVPIGEHINIIPVITRLDRAIHPSGESSFQRVLKGSYETVFKTAKAN